MCTLVATCVILQSLECIMLILVINNQHNWEVLDNHLVGMRIQFEND
jgi:hypothetical protein